MAMDNFIPAPWLQQQQYVNQQQADDQKYQDSLYRAYLQQLQQNAQQGISNANTGASMGNQMAAQQYNLQGDLASQQQRMASMYGDVLGQQQHNFQFGQNMALDVARGQTQLQNQQQNNNQYIWNADESLARTAYQRSMNEVPGYSQAMSKFGYH